MIHELKLRSFDVQSLYKKINEFKKNPWKYLWWAKKITIITTSTPIQHTINQWTDEETIDPKWCCSISFTVDKMIYS